MSVDPPPYWTDCPLVGQPIPNTPFITCKTPIDGYNPDAPTSSSLSSSSSLPQWLIPPEFTFTLSMLLRHVDRSLHRQLGLIIDLSDGRFYEPQPLCKQHGITYINLYLPPSTSPPSSSSSSSPPALLYDISPTYLSTLFRLLDTHIARHPASSILLHDIYSFDLSLYLISRYLVYQSLSPSIAYQAVCASRPPGISHPQLVRQLFDAGEEEVEWDLSILERGEWMKEWVGNWTWSGQGERGERRLVMEAEGKEGKEGDAKEEKKKTVRPAGTIRRKQKKESTAIPPSSTSISHSSSSSSLPASSLSSHSSPSNSGDPYNDMLADLGVASSPALSSSASANSTPLKRKAESSEAQPANKRQTAASPSSAPSAPLPSPPLSSSSPSTSSSLPVHQQHSYLVQVKEPQVQQLLSRLVALILSPSSHYSSSSFPLISVSELRAKLIVIQSWYASSPLTSSHLSLLRSSPSQYALSWRPASHMCLVLILKEGTFLLFPSPPTSSSLPSLPPLYHVPHLSFPTKSNINVVITNTVASAVLLFDSVPGSAPTPRLLLTDLLSSPSHNPLPPSIMKRIAIADSDIVLPRAQRKAVEGEKGGVVVGVRCKKWFPLSKLGSVLGMDVPHEKEGVEIVVEGGNGKRGGRIWVWNKNESQITEAELRDACR